MDILKQEDGELKNFPITSEELGALTTAIDAVSSGFGTFSGGKLRAVKFSNDSLNRVHPFYKDKLICK